jgi:hypothetical protein
MMDSVFLNAYLTNLNVMIFQEPKQSYFRWIHHAKVPSYLATRRETRMVTIPRVQLVQVLPHARHGRIESPITRLVTYLYLR